MDFEQDNSASLVLRNENEPTTLKSNITATETLPHDYIAAATSDNTRRAYQADIRHFICNLAELSRRASIASCATYSTTPPH